MRISDMFFLSSLDYVIHIICQDKNQDKQNRRLWVIADYDSKLYNHYINWCHQRKLNKLKAKNKEIFQTEVFFLKISNFLIKW